MLQRDIVRIILGVAAVGAGARALVEGSGFIGFLSHALFLGSCVSGAIVLAILAARHHWFHERWKWVPPFGFSQEHAPENPYWVEAAPPPPLPPIQQVTEQRRRTPVRVRRPIPQPHRVRAGRIQHDDARIPPGGAT